MAKCRTGTGKLWSDVKVGNRSKRASEMRQACDKRAGWGWVLVCSYPWVAAVMQLTSASPAKACAVPRYKFLENWSSKMIFAMLPVKVSSQSFSPVSVGQWGWLCRAGLQNAWSACQALSTSALTSSLGFLNQGLELGADGRISLITRDPPPHALVNGFSFLVLKPEVQNCLCLCWCCLAAHEVCEPRRCINARELCCLRRVPSSPRT